MGTHIKTLNIQNVELEVYYRIDNETISIDEIFYEEVDILPVIDLISYRWKKHFSDTDWDLDIFLDKVEELIRENDGGD